LASRIAPFSKPIFVDVKPRLGAVVAECFSNVQDAVRAVGGRSITGWILWEWPHTMLEAELHAVWEAPSGERIDVSPKPEGESKILFLSDESKVYDGTYTDNIRFPLRDDLVIKDYIRLSEMFFKATRIGKPGEPVTLDRAQIEPLAIRHNAVGRMLMQGLRDHDACFCGSNKKYKRCHALPLPR
jgi:hypothetical protein